MAKRPRLVASLTTTPTRIHKVEKTILSLLDGHISLDAVYLHVPYRFGRTGERYPEVPTSLTKLRKLIVNRTPDVGPATKILPITKREKSPDTVIVFVDDDITYPPDFVKTLLFGLIKYPGCAITGHGYPEFLPRINRVDEYMFETCLFAGFAGVLVERRMLSGWRDNIPLTAWKKDMNTSKCCFLSDDLTLSNHVMNRGHRIVAFDWRYIVAKLRTDDSGISESALHVIDSNLQKYNDCIALLKKNGTLNASLNIVLPTTVRKFWERLYSSYQQIAFVIAKRFAKFVPEASLKPYKEKKA